MPDRKIAFVTGATSGIGRSCAIRFAEAGYDLIIAGRRIDRLESFGSELKSDFGGKVLILNLDVRNFQEVESKVSALEDRWKAIDVLVNNAGLARGLTKIHEGWLEDWNEMIDTNIKGLLYVSRCVIPMMVKRRDGHVINIGSIAGHEVYPSGNVYCGTKHAVDAITKGMRMDLNGTGVRVTSIDPGLVETEFSIVRFRGDGDRANAVYKGYRPLSPDDVADAVMYAASRSKDVVVAQMVLLPSAQASAMIVDKKI